MNPIWNSHILQQSHPIAFRVGQYNIPIELRSENNDTALFSWLDRILDTADAKNNRSTLNELVHKILKRAAIDDHFKMIFFSIIQEATQTCGDRVSLSILHLSIEEKKADFTSKDTLTLQQMQELADFIIKGPWTLAQLEKIAHEHIENAQAQAFTLDEVAVYLAYPILLKNDLQIPIDVDEMLYIGSAHLTNGHLSRAKEVIRQQLGKLNAKANILASYDCWQVALEKYNETKDGYQAIIKEKQTRAELAQTPQEYLEIDQSFKDQIAKLSMFATG